MSESLNKTIIESIKKYDFESASKAVAELFATDMNSPKPHIFLGIISELQKNKPEAMRHFRAALALDGTDQVALYNLYRVGDGSREPIRFE